MHIERHPLSNFYDNDTHSWRRTIVTRPIQGTFNFPNAADLSRAHSYATSYDTRAMSMIGISVKYVRFCKYELI